MTKAKRWKPKKGDRYWYINSQFFAAVDIYNRRHVDIGRYQLGNCFESKEDADTAAEKVRALLLSLHDNAENLQDNIQDMVTNTCQALDKGKENVAEATCSFGKLPKLTTEVFDRPDCPEWAKYAAVSSDGRCLVCREYPVLIGGRRWANPESYWERTINGKFDASNWQNSLIERPVKETKLPDWCKVDAVGWCERYGYFKVTDIADEGVYVQRVYDNSKGYLSFHAVCSEAVHANSRPYNEGEMKALVGRRITMRDGSVCLCTAYSKPFKHVIFDNMHWDARELMDSGCTIDGKPCFVLEHLENGVWVE